MKVRVKTNLSVVELEGVERVEFDDYSQCVVWFKDKNRGRQKYESVYFVSVSEEEFRR